MQKYIVQPGDTADSIRQRFAITDNHSWQAILGAATANTSGTLTPGTEIHIPADAITASAANPAVEGEAVDSMNGYDDTAPEPPTAETKQQTQETQSQKGSTGSQHDGKYFVIQKGQAQCNQGFSFPNFKVSSHQKHYWNHAEGQADYLAVTEDDLQFNPIAQPFGQCKLKPSAGGYLPCMYAPAGKWQKTYDKVKVLGKSCVTEISELMCATGGKITVRKHGQQSQLSNSNVQAADAREQHIYNPLMNFEAFKEEVDPANPNYYT